VTDHPLRYTLVNELHARPFPVLSVPSTAAFMALMEEDSAGRDKSRDRVHLLDLLDRYGSSHPQPYATHFSGPIGRSELKWESHTEFVTYTAFTPGLSVRPFDPTDSSSFSPEWRDKAAGRVAASVLIRIEEYTGSDAAMMTKLESWFVAESLAVARVVDGAAVVAGDFRIDADGNMRFAVFVRPDTGARRVGRIVQRLCEIETYRAMSMLGLIKAREVTTILNTLDPRLSALVTGLDGQNRPAEDALHDLLAIASELESLAMQSSFRFGATKAYEAIVTQRITALREERLPGRQTFGEFMMRRYDPAMRTVTSTQARLHSMAERAQRAAELLRTRVDVERSAQNQMLLASMDRRADLALRLQHTVEGLSVVAISYYAVSLAAYVAAPLVENIGIEKPLAMGILTPLVVLAVWYAIRRIRRSMN
jgi:uncharacterized membrane-anchored protein